MRILIYGINYTPELTGIGKYTGEMSSWLATQGYDVSVITAMPYYPEWEVAPQYQNRWWHKEIIDGVKVYRCPFYVPAKVDSKKRIAHEFSFLWSSSFRWFAALFKKKYDLVITVCPPFHIGFSPYIYSIFKKTSLVSHIQDLQIDAAKDLNMLSNQKALNLMFKMEKFLLRKSDYVSTLTSGMKSRVAKKGISDDKIVMLPNWVDIDFIKPLSKSESLRDKFSISQDDIVILYSGNMGKKQGLEILLEVAGQYKDQPHIRFMMVGSGAEKDALKKMAADKGLTNMTFYPLQPYEQLSALLATADLHLVLQKREASDLVMPSKLTGILAAGGCAIVTAMPGTSLYEDIRNNNMGVLCEPESVAALKNAIDTALASDLTQIRTNARQYAENHLNRDKILSQFIDKVKNN
ncbi:colanic acid biosynthesis glycosyl transferase WcaI [Dysgonomonas sp. PFB1-18]|uniref:WcaI family glycosyltransferase n=1 Tax=unclassified Dysgonomonas TaxID=2630389 RepID=UPI002474BBE8|nr:MULTISPECIES: WcaI family glycosyltransferase [unclassified Dysgonomonas]MDH6308295.1 colanic acid biosynthesis glycosyl transferase WcaI [Dysgonomonas sp. PF1-14]MDH6338267.1 colanic acid biosynthesis glycosyl transferase WcaI [Dysgonomonas sp. PF1-16]MDH6379764.1 colanic acid biosynthesis glycosyl transferase WcaI [Dysgonomonas sp. PFB1-18]MDH6397146.1 colanic acid biosynthesis glycosyl transferase WcaI [Dysgonomonas sp. PF1-23]